MRQLALTSIITGVPLNLITSVVTSGSSSSSFGMMNQLQLIIVLPLLGSYIPEKIMDFINAMNDSLFSFSFLPFDNTTLVDYIEEKYSFDQPNHYLYLLQLKSGSAIVNMTNLLIVFGMIAGVHLFVFFIFLLFKYALKLTKVSNFIKKELLAMTFGTYLTIFTEALLIILFVLLSEIEYRDSSTIKYKDSLKAQQRESIKITYFFCSLILIFIGIVIWQFFKSLKPERFAKMKYFTALFEGLKQKRMARTFILIFLVRRIAF
jgi:hypothetical protein